MVVCSAPVQWSSYVYIHFDLPFLCISDPDPCYSLVVFFFSPRWRVCLWARHCWLSLCVLASKQRCCWKGENLTSILWCRFMFRWTDKFRLAKTITLNYLGLQWRKSNLLAHKIVSISCQSTVKFWFRVNSAFCSTAEQRSWKVGMFHFLDRSEFRARGISETLKINSNKNMISTLWPAWEEVAERSAWLPITHIVVWILHQI